MTGAPLLEVSGLRVEYRTPGWRTPPVVTVDDVSFAIGAGETMALVGESGSGKSTIARAVLGLVRPAAGKVMFDGRDVTHAGHRERRALARDISVVFQDPYSSLNPALTVGATLREPLQVHGYSRDEADATVRDRLTRVGLPADAMGRYPRQFSGGQRQRIPIARALTLTPRLLVCDEPVSALDLSIQAQVINLLKDLQRELSLAMLFVSHDLSVVRHVADTTTVLRRGRVVETGPTAEVHREPRHPYTVALLAAVPVPDPDEQARRRERRRAAAAALAEHDGLGPAG
ncbi:MAG TPA: ATP-binding cassette domain-containing protein [Acidimicrobiales bacterium]